MRYLVIGAGGTGGSIAAYMARAGKNVTLIARGKNLESIRKNGLLIKRPSDAFAVNINTVTEKEFLTEYATEKNSEMLVVFVCTKGYSLESIYPFLRNLKKESTLIIPILNIYGTGEKMSEVLPEMDILNGCIYIAAAIESPGIIRLSGDIFRIVYGRVDGDTNIDVLKKVESDLKDSKITPILSNEIKKDTFIKYSFVSPMAAAGAYYDASAGDFKKAGEKRTMFINCVKEIKALSDAMNVSLPKDIVDINLKIMDGLTDDMTTSLQKDLKKGNLNEGDGLITEVVRLGEKYNVNVCTYKKIIEKVLIQP